MKKTPKQKVIELAGFDASVSWKEKSGEIKGKVVDQIIDLLEPQEGESTSDLKARLLGNNGKGSVSNKKLVKLYNTSMRLKSEFGGKKANIVDALLNARKGSKGKVDADYQTHLEKKSVATLLLLHDHARKAGNL